MRLGPLEAVAAAAVLATVRVPAGGIGLGP